MSLSFQLRRRASFRFLAALLVCVSIADASAQLTLDVLKRDGYGVVPIRRPTPNTLIARGSINGRNADLVVDTGCAVSGILLDEGYSRGMSTEPVKERGHSMTGAPISFRKGTATSVALGNVQIAGVPLFFGAIQGLRDAEARRVVAAEGLIGAGFMRTCSAVIDLHNKQLYLRPPRTGRLAVLGPALRAVGLAEVPFVMVGNACVVEAEVDGVPAKMELDTGAYLGALDSRFAARTSLHGDGLRFGIRDAAGSTVEEELASVRSFKIGGVSVPVPKLPLSKIDLYDSTKGAVAGIIGMEILGPNWSVIDFGEQKLFFSPGK